MTENNLDDIFHKIKKIEEQKLIVLSLENFSYIINDKKEFNSIIDYIINTVTDKDIRSIIEMEDFKRIKELKEKELLDEKEKKELRELGEKFIIKKVINLNILDSDLEEFKEMKELEKNEIYLNQNKREELKKLRKIFLIQNKKEDDLNKIDKLLEKTEIEKLLDEDIILKEQKEKIITDYSKNKEELNNLKDNYEEEYSESTENREKELDKLIENCNLKLKELEENVVKELIELEESHKKELIENNTKELKKLINKETNINLECSLKLKEYYNKFCIVFPTGKKDKDNNEIKEVIIFDEEKVELKDYNDNDEKEDIINRNPKKTFNYNEYINEKLFFNIISDINNNGLNSNFLKTNENNGISIAYIVLKYCLEKEIVTMDSTKYKQGIVEYFNRNSNSFNNKELIKIFCKVGNIQVIRYLIQNGVNLDGMEEYIIFSNNPELIHLFEEQHIPFNYYNALKGACIGNGNKDIINYLDEVYEDEIINKDNLIKLFSVITNPRIAKIILDKFKENGYDINDRDNEKKTILYYAFKEKNLHLINFLLSEPNINLFQTMREILSEVSTSTDLNRDGVYIEVISHYALEEKNVEIIKLLCRIIFKGKNRILINKRNFCEKILRSAIEHENVKMVNFLLEQPEIHTDICDIFKSYKRDIEDTLVYTVMQKGNIKILELLISKIDLDINKKYGFYKEKTLLHMAIENIKNENDLEIIKFLLKQPNININIENFHNKTPFYCLISELGPYSKKISYQIFELFLSQSNLDVNAKPERYFSPLVLTLRKYLYNNSKKIIKYMEDNNIDFIKEDKDVLLHIIMDGFNYYKNEDKTLDMINILFSRTYLNINKIYDEKTVIYRAIELNSKKIVEFFISKMKENKINLIDKDADELLFIAIENNNPDIVKLLLLVPNININKLKKWDETPIKLAIKKNNPEIIKLLFSRQDLIIDDKYKNSLFKEAVRNKNLDMIENLINRIEEENEILKRNRDDIIFLAVKNNRLEILKVLLTQQDINNYYLDDDYDEEDFENKTLLYTAVNSNNSKIVGFLLSKMGNIELKEYEKNELLPIAVNNNNSEIVRLLLSRKDINVNTKIKSKKIKRKLVRGGKLRRNTRSVKKMETVLDIAVRNKNREIVELLLSRKEIEIIEELKNEVCNLLGREIEIEVKEDTKKIQSKKQRIKTKSSKSREKSELLECDNDDDKKEIDKKSENSNIEITDIEEENLDINETAKNISELITDDKILSNGEKISNDLSGSENKKMEFNK